MPTAYLEQAKLNAYYVDGFGVTKADPRTMAQIEQAMWYFLLMAAAEGEI